MTAAPSTNGTLDSRRGGVILPETPEPTSSVADQPQWVANLQIQRLLCVAMFACIGLGLSQSLIALGLSFWHAVSLGLVAWVVYSVGIALGGRAQTRHLRRYSEYGLSDWLLLLVPIVLVLKLLPNLLQGWSAVSAEVASWMDNPAHFFDMTLVWGLILVFLTWDEAVRNAESLALLSLQPGELPPSAGSVEYHDWMNSPYCFVDHTGAWQRLMWRFMLGGFLLLISTGIATIPVNQLGNADRPEVGGVMPHVLLYFLLGLVLAGQTSLDRLRSMWLRGGAVVQPGLARRWLGYGLGLVGVTLVIALILPTNFSDQSVFSHLPIIGLLLLPFRLFFGVFNWLLSHLAALLLAPFSLLVPAGSAAGRVAGPITGPPPVVPPDVARSAGPSLLTRIVFGLLLYVFPAALALYAVWNTWRKRRTVWRNLRSFWRDVWFLLKGAVLDLAAVLWRLLTFNSPRLLSLAPSAIQARLKRMRRRGAAEPEGAMGWLRLRGLNPRALIQYFYVSLAQRAEAVGWGRQPNQTAYEYSRDLATRLPSQRAEIEALTEAFVHAKYAPRDPDPDDAKRARTPWQRIRGALQTRRRTHQVTSWLGRVMSDE